MSARPIADTWKKRAVRSTEKFGAKKTAKYPNIEEMLLAKNIRFFPSHSLRGMLRKTPRFIAMGEIVTNQVASG